MTATRSSCSSRRPAAATLAATNLCASLPLGPAVDQLLADEQLTPAVGGGDNLTSPGATVWTLTDNEGTVRDLATYNAQTGHNLGRQPPGVLRLWRASEPDEPADGPGCGGRLRLRLHGSGWTRRRGCKNNDDRWYDAITGRWLSQDPIGLLGQTTNLYGDCDNSPTIVTDPTGLVKYDLKFIRYLVKKYHLSKEGQEALHRRITKKGMEKCEIEAEQPAIEGLRGKFIDTAGGIGDVIGGAYPLNSVYLIFDISRDLSQGKENARSFWEQHKWDDEECPFVLPNLPNPSYNPSHNPFQHGPMARWKASFKTGLFDGLRSTTQT